MNARGAAVAVAVAGLIAAIAAAVLLPALPLPVAVHLRGSGAPVTRIAVVAGRIALAVPAALAALGCLLPPRRRPRLLITAAAAPITVFLVAQANGERDLGGLVLVYAAAAAAVLVRGLGGDRAWSLAAALGIVPWGVIAFLQVAASLAGAVPLGVRVVTLAVLAASIAEFAGSRRSDGPVLAVLPAALLGAGSFLL